MWYRVALSLAAAVAGAALAAAGIPAASSAPEQAVQPFPGGPYYAIGCSVSHRLNDDPIMFPGQPGRSHNHTFIGNNTVDAWTTPASLLGGSTSCADAADSSGYWIPTLYDGREAVFPLAATVYWVDRSRQKLRRLPRGLVMIAGDAAARSRQPTDIVAWSCGARSVGDRPRYATVQACHEDEMLQLQVTFPSCWNGQAVNSPDHKRHVAYESRGLCPASHPVALPTLVLVVLYPPVPREAQVASGRFGAHADFMNGWTQNVLKRLDVATS